MGNSNNAPTFQAKSIFPDDKGVCTTLDQQLMKIVMWFAGFIPGSSQHEWGDLWEPDPENLRPDSRAFPMEVIMGTN